ncbi:MAG: acetate kinase, partial [Kiritimatiellae bacterium]|nr:acetate kinase [Kiritimatiellia bacterium]
AVQAGMKEAKEAFDLFVHRIILYIGGYMALLGKVDGIVFAGGIGENSDFARKAICERLAPLGLKLDAKANKATHGTLARISAADSKLPAWVIPTNEELMIARETYRIVAAR